MNQELNVGIVGDYQPTMRAHQATDAALLHTARALNITIRSTWLPTPSLERNADKLLHDYAALLCAPASPYQSDRGALNAIRFAREQRIPFLGNCGGFQYTVIEYARNVLNMPDAQHAETHPEAETLIISSLPCSLVEKRSQIRLLSGSLIKRIYQQEHIEEGYYCNYGVNPLYHERLERGGLRIGGMGAEGTVHAVELPNHPFFIGTLFQPQLSSKPERPSPIFTAWLRKASEVAG